MKKILVIMAILVIILPFLLIVQRFTGWEIISVKEYFLIAGAFLIGYCIQNRKNDKQIS